MPDDILEKFLCSYRDRNLLIVTAESCTAGLAASEIARMPGCGSILDSSFVVYSEKSKMKMLGIPEKVLKENNLTSEAVAKAMAEEALARSGANVAISNTGVAGPGDGDGGIKAGTVCFGWSFARNGRTETYTETRKFEGDRNKVREQAAQYSIKGIEKYSEGNGKQRSDL